MNTCGRTRFRQSSSNEPNVSAASREECSRSKSKLKLQLQSLTRMILIRRAAEIKPALSTRETPFWFAYSNKA